MNQKFLRRFSLAIVVCPRTDFCKRQTEFKICPKMSHLSCTLMRELSVPEQITTILCSKIIIYSYRPYESISDSKRLAKNSREQVNSLKWADEVVRGHRLLSAKDRANHFICRSKIKISLNPKISGICYFFMPCVIPRLQQYLHRGAIIYLSY